MYKYDDFEYASDTSASGSGNNIGENAFGVRLIQTVDHYDKSERAAKYAILIIALSFWSFSSSKLFTKIRYTPFSTSLSALH